MSAKTLLSYFTGAMRWYPVEGYAPCPSPLLPSPDGSIATMSNVWNGDRPSERAGGWVRRRRTTIKEFPRGRAGVCTAAAMLGDRGRGRSKRAQMGLKILDRTMGIPSQILQY